MPGYSCSIKERMLYSSCKNQLLEDVERDFHIEITKKVRELVTPNMLTSFLNVRFFFLIINDIWWQNVFFFLQLEIDSGESLTEENLYEEVHPKPQTLKQVFAKPKGPTGKRGNKRLIKGAGENGEES